MVALRIGLRLFLRISFKLNCTNRDLLMSYHNYTTEGIVLKGRPVGEADKYFYILTKDLGLIIANAKSVRKSESKLSCGLEDFSKSTFSFIRGKYSWRVTSAQPDINTLRFLANDPSKKLLWARFLALVQRMVMGEEKHIAIFSICQNLFYFLTLDSYSDKQLLAIESLAILKLLPQRCGPCSPTSAACRSRCARNSTATSH